MTVTQLTRCCLRALLTALPWTKGAASESCFERAEYWLEESLRGRWTPELIECLEQQTTHRDWLGRCRHLSKGLEIDNALYNWDKLKLSPMESRDLLLRLRGPSQKPRESQSRQLEGPKETAGTNGPETTPALPPAAIVPAARFFRNAQNSKCLTTKDHPQGIGTATQFPWEMIQAEREEKERRLQFWRDVQLFRRHKWQEWDAGTGISKNAWDDAVERFSIYADEIARRDDRGAMLDLWGILDFLGQDLEAANLWVDLYERLGPKQLNAINSILRPQFNWDFRSPS